MSARDRLGRAWGKLAGEIRGKNLERWLPGYLADQVRGPLRDLAGDLGRSRWPRHRHLLFALCDHFEPRWKAPPPALARQRVQRWSEGYPRLAAGFRDADGRRPRHSFFFPAEEYQPESLDALAGLGRAGLGEVELHLHHDGDTPENFRQEVGQALARYAGHGHLSQPAGRPRYGFIHGNWCLANARKDGRWCGIDAELPLLHETGCYADFTFPAAPDESQPALVNRLYWPSGDLRRRRAADGGRAAKVGESFSDRILIIGGPLALSLRPSRRFVRIENGDITGANPATAARVDTWVRQNIHVEGRPEWVFVKVHTHGAQEAHEDALLGAGARRLHEALGRYNDGVNWSLHYVTAREMYNVARAAMAGQAGNPAEHFDFQLPPPPIATA
jgi:hypothetical protein